MNLSEIFIRRPIATTLIMVAIFFFGVTSYFRLPVSDLPSINFPAITVSIVYPGADPNTVADNVVGPLEREFLTIDGLETMASTSVMGRANIVLQFSLSKTIDSAAQDVQAAINQATPLLPQDLPYAPVYSKVNPSQTPIVWFAAASETMPLYELYDYAYTYLGKRLSTVEGVAQVVVYGTPYAVRVRVDPQKLAAKGIGINEAATAIQQQNVYLPLGTLFGEAREYTLRADGQINRAELYNNVIIKEEKGAIVRVRDVGRAIDSLNNDKQYMRYVGNNQDAAAIVFGIQTRPGVNSMNVMKDVDTLLPQLIDGLPKSITLNRLFDKSDYIKESVSDVLHTLLIAFILVVVIIFLYLGRAIDTIIPTIALPLVILGTFAAMSLLGFSIDILSLMAITLSIGFLIDDAIVVLENIVRHVEKGKTIFQAALDGSREISLTIVSMTLSLIAVFIPLVFMGGVIGKIFSEFALVIVVAMLISGFISLSLTPMLCSRFIAAKKEGEPSRVEKLSHWLNSSLQSIYSRGLNKVLKHPRITLAAGLGCLIWTFLLFRSLPTDFLPADDIGFIIAHTQAKDGTSPFKMIDYQKKLTDIAKNTPYLDSLVSLGAMPEDNKGVIFYRLKPLKDRPPIQKVIDNLYLDLQRNPGTQVYLKAIPLIDLQVSTSDINAPYQYTLQSLSTDDLYTSAETIIRKIKETPGIKNVSTDMEILQPQLNLHILRDKASSLNISAFAIENAMSLAYGTINLSPINEPGNQYYAIMEVEPRFYRDPQALSQIYLRSTTNQLVPLTTISEMNVGIGPFKINRIDALPAVNIFFDLDKIPLSTGIERINEAAREILPPSVSGNVKGTADVFKESFADLNYLLIITIFVIYIILGILYENFLHPLTVMSTLPPAALGGLITLQLFNTPLSLYAFVGFLLLLGIVLKNGIIMIDFAIELERTGKTPQEAITEACLTRFRPILMTTLAALMGALPIALGLGGLTAISRIPLGLVIVGGLIVSQILTLFFTPIAYLYFEKLRKKFFI